jgi:hypothetical protein
MKNRDYRLFFEDALRSANKILKYTKGINYEKFVLDEMLIEAVERNFEIIGEALGHVPEDVRTRFKEIPFREIVGLRNILIHNYLGVDYEILWGVIKKRLPDLKSALESALIILNNEMNIREDKE